MDVSEYLRGGELPHGKIQGNLYYGNYGPASAYFQFLQEYLSIGVEWIWIVDPQEQSALLYSQQNPAIEIP